jgi:hypothetical protein
MAIAPTSPGRPVKDKALRELVSNPPAPVNNSLNDRLICEYLGGLISMGCEVSVCCTHSEIYGPVWRGKFYVAGKQRVIVRGTLSQCVTIRHLAREYWTLGRRDLLPSILEYFSKLDQHFTSGREVTRIASLEKRISALEQRLKPNPKYVSINS